MPKFWSMGVSASNVTHDLTARAQEHNAMREAVIEREAAALAERSGLDPDTARHQVREAVDGARRRMRVAGGEQTPNLADHGVAAPVVINGETYGTVGVHYERGGDRIIEAVRPLGGGRFATRRIVQRVEGGERTRVVSEARGS